MPIIHVSYDFTRLPDEELDGFTEDVSSQLYGNAAYPNPPVVLTALTGALQTFTEAMAAQAQGGPAATAAKNDAREALLAPLRQLAGFVDENHHNNLATLLSSGFKAQSTNRAQSPLPAAVVDRLEALGGGSVLAVADPMDNATGWEARWRFPGEPDTAFHHAENQGAKRKMTIVNLPRLKEVEIQMRAQGGSTGFSAWSQGVIVVVT